MHLTQPPPDPRDVAPERQIPRAARRRHAQGAREGRRRTASRTPTSSSAALARGARRDRGAREPARASTASTSAARVVRRAQPAVAEVLRRLRAPATRRRSCRRCRARAARSAPPAVAPREPAVAAPAARLERADPRRAGRCPFVGREDDLAWLEARRAEARLAVRGAHRRRGRRRQDAPLREFLDVAAAAGDVVVQTGPDPAWAEVGYWALRRAIVAARGAARRRAAAPRDWVAASPRRGAGSPTSSATTAPEREPRAPLARRAPLRRRRGAALGASCARASGARGHRVVLAVDDLHCVDGASRNAFADALSEPPLVPALLIATYAPGFDPGWAGDVARGARPRRAADRARWSKRSSATRCARARRRCAARATIVAALPRAAPPLRCARRRAAPRRASPTSSRSASSASRPTRAACSRPSPSGATTPTTRS